MKKYIVAVVGATGVVGQEMINVLEQRKFPVKKLVPLASERSLGMTVKYKGENVDVQELKPESFENIDIALFSAGGSISEKFAPEAVQRGAVVIDNTSHFRMDNNVPLVVPEVNADALKEHQGIIANPNCSTAQLVVALKPIHDYATIERVVVSTYQSVSGAGKEAISELENQTRSMLNGQGQPEKNKFPYTIAFNVIPHIDVFLDNGYTKEEMKMIEETQKILDSEIAVTATTVRVPVFIGHSESVNIQTKKKISAKKVRELLKQAPGIEVQDDPASNIYPTPQEASGKDPVYAGRIREDISMKNGIELWCVADNLRKGAALNAVQIAEELIK
ncbi:MAG: aspartate-semialdehyde dehydrogenase [bacterium]|nr:aspartate-semialdehyde dehydrogenase [bacterium]